MKKNKAFTMVEMVIVLAISALLFGAIAGISAITNNIIKTQKVSTACVQEYQTGKTEIENFVSAYASDYFQFEILENSTFEIYNSESVLVAKSEFKAEEKTLKIYELDESLNLVESSSNKFSKVKGISFDYDEVSNLVKCEVEFENYHDCVFLINLGGMQVGNIY